MLQRGPRQGTCLHLDVQPAVLDEDSVAEPATCMLLALAPSGAAAQQPVPAGLRVDTWIDSGTNVTPFYDSLLAKLMVLGEDRAQAIRQLRAALDQVVLSGIPSNLECAQLAVACSRCVQVRMCLCAWVTPQSLAAQRKLDSWIGCEQCESVQACWLLWECLHALWLHATNPRTHPELNSWNRPG